MKKLGVYIHIPFCIKKCFYCDFYSEPIGDPQFHRKYVKALIKEIIFYGENMGKEYQIDTIFIGGGTPSILEPIFIREILSALKKYFYVEKNAEITIECNPATLSEEKLQAYREEGINRISIGVQSLDDRLLLTLGRVHSSQDVFETVEQVRKAGFQNMNLDAMFGVPDQSISIWRETVKGILQLHPEHISFYSLELAENTLFYNLYKAGKLKITAISRDRKMYHFIIDEMRKAGLFQYEISNGAKPGFACRHNLKYWNLEEYLGLGASAHSYIDRTRFSNIADASCYVAAME